MDSQLVTKGELKLSDFHSHTISYNYVFPHHINSIHFVSNQLSNWAGLLGLSNWA